jgi:hypothetical protein
MSRITSRTPDSAAADLLVAADVLMRQEPHEEEDDEEVAMAKRMTMITMTTKTAIRNERSKGYRPEPLSQSCFTCSRNNSRNVEGKKRPNL